MKKNMVHEQRKPEEEDVRGTLRYHLLPPLGLMLCIAASQWFGAALPVKAENYDLCLALIVIVCLLGLLAGVRMGCTATDHSRADDRTANRCWLLCSLPLAFLALLTLLCPDGLPPGFAVVTPIFALLQPGFCLLLLVLCLLHNEALILLAPFAYRLMILLGCHAAQAWRHGRKRVTALCLAAGMLIAAGLPYAMVQHTYAQHQLPPGYGFAYERGLSSTDLTPYSPFNPYHILPTVESSYRLRGLSGLPVLDGAEAAYPVYAAFANACFDDLARDSRPTEKIGWYDCTSDHLRFTNTQLGFTGLLRGQVDIFFGAMPSAAQRREAAEAGAELVLIPIALEGFVFITSPENPVQNLTTDDIRGVYSGRITSWRSLGGSGRIMAFQRPEGSGSQTLLRHIMDDTPIMPPLTEETIGGMLDLIQTVADYRNDRLSLGYTFRFFLNGMHREVAYTVRTMRVNGVPPTAETIQNGSYPFTTYLYAITVKDNPRVPQAFLDWMQGPEAQQMVETLGYVPLPAAE